MIWTYHLFLLICTIFSKYLWKSRMFNLYFDFSTVGHDHSICPIIPTQEVTFNIYYYILFTVLSYKQDEKLCNFFHVLEIVSLHLFYLCYGQSCLSLMLLLSLCMHFPGCLLSSKRGTFCSKCCVTVGTNG